MTHTARAREHQHRTDAAEALERAGVAPWIAGRLTQSLPGYVAKALAEQLASRAAAFTNASGPQTPVPTIVYLCGSTRFWREFQEASLRETLAGKIVLSIGAARGRDDDDKTFGGYVPQKKYDQVKAALDALHLRKIEMSDEVLILNVGGYIGDSTGREVAQAERLGKKIRWWEERAEAPMGPASSEEPAP